MLFLEGTFPVSVYYEDTDFSGYVYHANYLKFFERAREEIVGIDYVRELYKRGLHYVVANVDISFKAPARHRDRLVVHTRMPLTASPVSTVEQEARLSDRAIVVAKVKIVAVDGTGRSTRVPDDVVAHLSELANKSTQVPFSPV